MVMNKKAWLRIFEVSIAVVLILSSILLIYNAQQGSRIETDTITDWQVEILRTIADDNDLRNYVVQNNSTAITDFINDSISSNLNFYIRICPLVGSCSLDAPGVVGKEIFVQERIISGTIEEYSPKRLRFFIWGKEN